jgi:hypothetical protein
LSKQFADCAISAASSAGLRVVFSDTILTGTMTRLFPRPSPSTIRLAAFRVMFSLAILSNGLLVFGTRPAFAAAAARQFQEQRSGSNRVPGAESPLPVFEFHSGFWVNLHHLLYLQARLSRDDFAAQEPPRGAIRAGEYPVSLNDFPAAEIRDWQDAVAFYAKDLARRDLNLNGDMVTINNRLAEMETCTDLAGKTSTRCKSGLQSGLVEVLDRAAVVYRAHWWSEQDRANREWIAEIAPMVSDLGVELSGQLADVYQRPWPSGRLRVDVVGYAGPFGAYSSLNPVHVTISSRDARNQGIYGFEVLFHESSHTLAGAVIAAISHEFRERDKPIPRNLWHALLFYTTGELIRRDLAYQSIPRSALLGIDPLHYEPYAMRFGIYSGAWDRFHGELDLYWQPYLEGRTSFESAIARLAAAE